MWRRFIHGEGNLFFGRGDIKFIILELLKDKPKHGYEIMKDIEARVGGFYSASAGSVYPTLQMLEDQGYVTSNTAEGKKVYEITQEGRGFLERNQETVRGIHGRCYGSLGFDFGEDQREIFREAHDLVHAIIHEVRRNRDLTAEQWRQIREVMVKARRDIEDILSKKNA